MTTSFISTAIPFVNARPHVGFAYELVLADILARHKRRRGRNVRFTSGTDDNSLKNVTAAERDGLTPRELVDRNAAAFRALGPLLNISTDDFIETSRDPRHRPTVEWLWRRCTDDLYRKEWTGRYCAGCEAFVDDGVELCPEHLTVPEPVAEENWFFRLSRYREQIRDAILTNRLAILSDAARAETLAFLDGDVRDLSVSRVASRSRGWGIPVPDDPAQVIYVWFDALANYLTSLDASTDSALYASHWRDGTDRTHIIGKGITRFHTVYWPAFLLSAGLPLPDRVAVHGYLLVNNEKLSKSRRTLDVDPLVAQYGTDAVRWYFARRCRTRVDVEISETAIVDAHDGDLADRVGNLVQRCITLAHKLCDGRVPRPTAENELAAHATALPARVDAALDAFLVDDAAGAIIELVDAANRTLEREEPWRRGKTDPVGAAASLYAPLEAARIAIGEASPFVPALAASLLDRLGTADLAPSWGRLVPGTSLRRGDPPVPRLRPPR